MEHQRPTPRAPERDDAANALDVPAFFASDSGRVRLLCAPRFESALRETGLFEAAHLLALVDSLRPDASRRAGRASTHVVATDAGAVHVKRALKGGVLAPLFFGRVPRFARVAGELEVTAWLRARGAPVLEPVVAAGVRDALGWRAILGTVEVPYAIDGASALELAVDGDRGRSEPGMVTALCLRFGRAIRAFHDAGGQHADLAVTNLLHDPHGDAVRVIDLQGGHAGQAPPASRRRSELERLRRSIEHRPSIEAALAAGWPALVAGYCEPATPWSEALAASLTPR